MISIPPEEQAESLLFDSGYSICRKYLNGDYPQLKQHITISIDDLKMCIEQKGYPDWICFEKGMRDGLYVVEEKDYWAVYQQDRGQKMYENQFSSKEEALNSVLSGYLKR